DEVDDMPLWWLDVEMVTGYRDENPQAELYRHIKGQLGRVAVSSQERPCRGDVCASAARAAELDEIDREFERLETMKGPMLAFVPDVAFVHVELGGDEHNDLAYTLLADKSYKSVSSMFAEEKLGDRRDYAQDRQTVLPWLESAYPNFFYVVAADDVPRFVRDYEAIENREDYERFIAHFGVRRTNPRFWAISDWFNERALRERPARGGLFDLNRYENR
ncbi:MAG TPA: fatty acid cis/trans isomerase, partial [Polyangiaceae bacterium]|nr:fatty acid cis/trans isomerase [Polyangiaceae bacterium]